MFTYVIIDDESLTRKGTIKKLEALSDRLSCIGEASNGTEALSLIANTDPDIIITDMNMPVMDGTQFLPMLTERFPDKKVIVISGFKDYEYMQHALKASALDYILKPFSKEEIQDAAERAMSQIETKKQLHNQILSSEEETENANFEYAISVLKNMILGLHTEKCTIASKRLNFVNSTHDLTLLTLHSHSLPEEKMLQAFLNENHFGDFTLYLQHAQYKSLGFLILFTAEHSVVSPQVLCQKIVEAMDRLFSSENITVSYGVSAIHHSLDELHAAYLETVSALNSQQMNSGSRLFFPTEKSTDTPTITWEKSKEFFFRLETGMTEKVQELLTDFIDNTLKGSGYTLYQIKVYFFSLSDEVRYILSKYIEQVNLYSANSSMHNILDNMFSLDELKQYYLQYYTNIADILRKQNIYSSEDVIGKIKTYVDRHYYDDLTIEFISSLFYMNRSYLSHLFKEKTGETFVYYLNSVRLTRAAELLTTTDKKMYQIAKSLGYDNVKYFFRVFKKYYKITPEQYRLKYSQTR